MTKRKRTLFALLAIVGVAVIALVVMASRRDDLVLIGVIDANDVVVTPRVQARLDSLFVDEGSEVKAGQLIATLESSELAAQAASVAAMATSAEAQLRESRSSALQVTGTTEATQSAARSRLASARAALARELAQLAQDSANAARATKLAESGGLSPADLDKANNAYHAQQAVTQAQRDAVSAAEADVANAQSGTHAVAAARSAV